MEKMRTRGKVYWGWADFEIHFRNINERVPDGTLINIQVRTSRAGDVQLFIGVYEQNGTMLFEEAFDSRPGESMTQAEKWGIARATEIIDMTKLPKSSRKPERLPRKGSRQAS